VFILSEIKVLEVKVFEFVSLVESSESVQHSQHKGTCCRCCVMPIGKWWRDISEGSIGLLRGHVQIENRPTTDQKSRVRSSLAMGARIVDDHLILKFRIMKFTIEHLTKSHEVTKIQRTKIKKEIPINELCVSREIMN
jgi:hypothetical protein